MPAKNKKKQKNQSSSYKHYGVLYAFITLMLFIILCWYAYIYFVEQSTKQGVVYIKADKTAFKIIPDDPGGMVVEYKDKKVFDRITGDSEDLNSDIKVIKEESPITEDEIERIIVKTSVLNKEEYRDAAKTILTPIIKKGKEEGVKVHNHDEIKTFDELVELVDEGNDSIEVEISEQPFVEEEKIVGEEDGNQELEKESNEVEQAAKNQITKTEITQEITQGFKDITDKVVGKEKSEDKPKKQEEKKEVLKPSLHIPQNIKFALKPDELLTNPAEIIVDAQDVKIEKNAKTGKNKTTITFANAPKSLAKNKTISQSSSGKSGFYVQISSHSRKSDLETSWALFKNRFSDIVGSKSKHISKAEVNGSSFYRLSFGPYGGKSQASSKCSALKSKGKDCLIKYY